MRVLYTLTGVHHFFLVNIYLVGAAAGSYSESKDFIDPRGETAYVPDAQPKNRIQIQREREQ